MQYKQATHQEKSPKLISVFTITVCKNIQKNHPILSQKTQQHLV